MWRILRSQPVACLLIAAFVLRLAAAVFVQHWLDGNPDRRFVIEGDAEGYWMLGEAIADGDPYAVYNPPRRVLRMPGFPALIAIPIGLTNGNFLATRYVLAAMGTLAVACVYLLGRDLVDAQVGLIAGWYCAVSPVMVGFSAMILSETVFALGIVLTLWFAARLSKCLPESNWLSISRDAILTGLAIALATYFRPSWLPAAGVIPLGIAARGRLSKKSLFAGALIAVAVLLALSPWAVRNHRVTGHWIVTTLWSGPSLYDGFHAEADGSSDMSFLQNDGLLTEISEYELNRHYWQKGWRYAQNNPGRAVELAFLKQWRYWKLWPSAAEAGNVFSRLLITLFSLVLFVGACVGGWRRRRNVLLLTVTLGPILFFAALHAVFVGSLRYRLPAEYPLAVLAAIGWMHLSDRFRPTSNLGGET